MNLPRSTPTLSTKAECSESICRIWNRSCHSLRRGLSKSWDERFSDTADPCEPTQRRLDAGIAEDVQTPWVYIHLFASSLKVLSLPIAGPVHRPQGTFMDPSLGGNERNETES